MCTIRAVIEPSKKTTADVECRIVATQEERAAAFRLVYSSYLRAGLTEPNWHGMRVTPYHLLPTTEMFAAVCEGEVISTVSLMLDGELGLPMESVYEREIAARRRQGVRMGELSCLADRRSDFKRSFPMLVRLCRLVAQYARTRGLHELVVAVHPRHSRFYQRFMAFMPIGNKKAYPSARNHPAVALCLNFEQVDRERPRNWEMFFGQLIPPAQLKPQPITREQCNYFGSMLDPAFNLAPLGGTADCDHSVPMEVAGIVA